MKQKQTNKFLSLISDYMDAQENKISNFRYVMRQEMRYWIVRRSRFVEYKTSIMAFSIDDDLPDRETGKMGNKI